MDSKSSFRILVFPWLAHGHVFPFLELSKKLFQKNFQIYFCSTSINLDSVKKSSNLDEFSIELIELQLPSIPELPPHYHTTKNIPPNLLPILMQAFQSSSSNFSDIITKIKPDSLIYDGFQPWAANFASSQGIPSVHFCNSGSTPMSFFHHLHTHKRFDTFPFPEIYLHGYEIMDLMKQGESLKMGDGDEDFLNDLYISFGSENYLSKEQIEEIAKGLELSNVNFIWVVRFPIESDTSIDDALPNGFLERVKDRGIIEEKWAPQAEILPHENVGGFMSHCGWSSVMESIYFGVPIVAVPLKFDQPVNSRLMVEIGVGVEVKRDDSGKFSGENVGEAISKVIAEESGEGFRSKVRELSEKVKMEEENGFDEVAEQLSSICMKK
ncbi:hypothetical protein RD792_017158 [Penstemon davidsonii]|uniref:Glycosyltransferase n=1 Tax=Penstemon davidsonii TaxID=160366 RepID=A0ABR0CNP0_9LAMI|nr:hypothetical protein RD792_017158 [Penstemon davidsonii]